MKFVSMLSPRGQLVLSCAGKPYSPVPKSRMLEVMRGPLMLVS